VTGQRLALTSRTASDPTCARLGGCADDGVGADLLRHPQQLVVRVAGLDDERDRHPQPRGCFLGLPPPQQRRRLALRLLLRGGGARPGDRSRRARAADLHQRDDRAAQGRHARPRQHQRDGQIGVDWFEMNADTRCLLITPLFHINGIIASVVSPLLAEGSTFIVEWFRAASFWATVQQVRPTYFSAVPTTCAIVVSGPGEELGEQVVVAHAHGVRPQRPAAFRYAASDAVVADNLLRDDPVQFDPGHLHALVFPHRPPAQCR
jgi:AMP-binding enzyme